MEWESLTSCGAAARVAGVGGEAGADGAVDAAWPAAGVTVQVGLPGCRNEFWMGEWGGQEPGGGAGRARTRHG